MRRTEFNLEWKKYEDFFSLYEKRSTDPRMLYVIGDQEFVYIGLVGIRGSNGLKQRYQKSYVLRAKSIFGMATPDAQPAYAASIKKPKAPGNKILDLEETIQDYCICALGDKNVTFTKRKKQVPITVISTGCPPHWIPPRIDT